MPVVPKTSGTSDNSATLDAVTGPDFRAWLDHASLALGFDRLRITDTNLGLAPERLRAWLAIKSFQFRPKAQLIPAGNDLLDAAAPYCRCASVVN
jgi:hypothetical protein